MREDGPPRAAAELVLCETCRRSSSGGTDGATPPDGERLAALVARELASAGPGPLRLVRTRCLWACKRSCSAHVRAPGRPGYVLGDLEPTAAAAQGLVAWAQLYAASPDGAVPFRSWPDAVRGHFLCRIPATEKNEATEREETP